MPHDALSTLRRIWWIPLVALACSLLVSFVLTRGQRPVYRGTASVVVTPNSELMQNVRDEIDALDTLDRRSVIATFARLAKKRQVVRLAAERAGVSSSGYSVRSLVPANTNIIEIHVEGPEGATAAKLANAVAEVASEEATVLYRTFLMRPLDEATEQRRPVRPDLQRNLLAAAAVGLAAGLFLAVLVDAAFRLLRRGEGGAAAT